MNIVRFVEYLNRTEHLHIDAAYYAYIDQWKQWWRGFVPQVHDIKETASDGSTISRHMASLRMPKAACEDWASLLLNDKTTVTIADHQSAAWLVGNDDQTGGLLRQLAFWPNANKLVELAFRSGTGAFVLSVEGTTAGQIGGKIVLDYAPAECILPISVRHGVVEEVAFASEVTVDGHSCIYLQLHQLVKNPAGGRQYKITNRYFESHETDGESADYTERALPPGVARSLLTGADVPLFALFSPAVVKNLPGGPGLGMAVFSEAVDAAAQVDLAFDNYKQDLFLGGKKVFYNKRLMRPLIGADGQQHFIPPDNIRRQQFFQVPDAGPDDPPDWHEYNPDLRVEANSKAVQDALDYFSFKCGLGTRRYRFELDGAKTATEYNGSRQDMVQHANRHQIQIEAALIQIFRAMLWAGKTQLGAPVDPETEITINFDDSYITDSETRRAQYKQDALDGFLPRYRYLMEWYGMSEAEAKQAVQEAGDETGANEPISFFPGGDA
jgi:A118 family predicted phage portal protein